MTSDGPLVSIIIPTQRRLLGLEVAVRSIFAQAGVEFSKLELVIVDNDQVPSAMPLVARLKTEAPLLLSYFHVPESGVANARNAALKQARGRLLAFLDDDEEANPQWLAALLQVQAEFEADVVFGPVRGRIPEGTSPHRAYLEWFFSRLGSDVPGPIDGYYGCGNSLIRRAAMPDGPVPFSAARNRIGGEDDVLFEHMKASGARLAWSPLAWVWEDPLPERLSLAYTFSRAFAYGHGPTLAAKARSDWFGVAFWMCVGLGQASLGLLLVGALALIRSPQTIPKLDYVIRCLGKTFWWGPFQKAFYGQTISPASTL